MACAPFCQSHRAKRGQFALLASASQRFGVSELLPPVVWLWVGSIFGFRLFRAGAVDHGVGGGGGGARTHSSQPCIFCLFKLRVM